MKPKAKPKQDGPVTGQPVSEVKVKGAKPELRGLIQVETNEPLIKNDKAVLKKNGEPVMKSKDVGDFAVWLPKPTETENYNPLNPDYFGNLTLLGRHGKIGLFVKKDNANKKFPVITGEVYDGGRNIIGQVALWPTDSSNKASPKYVGNLTVSETGFKYRLAVWGPKE